MPNAYAPTEFQNGYEFSQGSGYLLPQYPSVVPPAVHSGMVEHARIAIVGGGITGLTIACALAQLGVEAILLDEDNSVGVKGASSRGICYTQKSLEIFDKLGIYERIKAKGVQWSVGRTFAGNDEVYSFDLKQQNAFNLSAQPAFINIQQFYNEGYLVERIQELGHAQIRWNNRLLNLTKRDGKAALQVATQEGEYTLTADFIVDATGARSPFRDWLGARVTAKKGDDRWCIADVRFDTKPPTERHTWIEAPFNDNRAVWQHLMADDVWRIDYQMAPDADPAYVSRGDVVRERLAKQFGADVKVDIVWAGPYAYRSECVDKMAHSWGKSQVFFIGDSAKVVSPFGARGGNTGIADADNLAWKLAAVVQGRAPAALLASYHAERHEAATTNVQVTNRTARFLRPADGMERVFRTAVIDLAKRHAFARPLINTGRMAVANPYSRSGICAAGAGTSVQNVEFAWGNGSAGQLNDLLRWAGGHMLLLVFGALQSSKPKNGKLPKNAASRLRQLHKQTGLRVVQVLQAVPANALAAPSSVSKQALQALESVQDVWGHLAKACGIHTTANARPWALLRPDGYLAATGSEIDTQLARALARSLGAQA